MEILYSGDWVDLVNVDGYESLDEPNVVFIFVKRIFNDGNIRYAIRSEYCPPYSTIENYYTIMSGKIDDGENAHEAAIRELEEEAGIKLLDVEKMRYAFDSVPVCKSTNMRATLMYCAIDEKDLDETYTIVDIKGDGTENEKKSSTLWFTFDELIKTIEENENFDLLFYLATFIYRETQSEDE